MELVYVSTSIQIVTHPCHQTHKARNVFTWNNSQFWRWTHHDIIEQMEISRQRHWSVLIWLIHRMLWCNYGINEPSSELVYLSTSIQIVTHSISLCDMVRIVFTPNNSQVWSQIQHGVIQDNVKVKVFDLIDSTTVSMGHHLYCKTNLSARIRSMAEGIRRYRILT